MYDFRDIKTIDLENSECLKEKTTYKYKDSLTDKELIAKFISNYDDSDDSYLISEFKKLALLSGEPEIALVHYIAKAKLDDKFISCYVMDFVNGDSLERFLNKRDSIIYEVLYDILIQISTGLEKAHHFDIYHSDLHNENIIINQNGYVKLIDFLWWDYRLPKKDNLENDIKNFKRISNEFYEKCKKSDKDRFNLINNYCQNIKTLKGLKFELELINDLNFELSLLDNTSIKILSKLFELTGEIYKLKRVIKFTEDKIPNKFDSKLTEQEKTYKKENENPSSIKLKFTDTRHFRIEDNISVHFDSKFHNLKSVGLIDWKFWLTNNGISFEGPYQINLEISFKSKFFKWKKNNELLNIIENSKTDFDKLILD